MSSPIVLGVDPGSDGTGIAVSTAHKLLEVACVRSNCIDPRTSHIHMMRNSVAVLEALLKRWQVSLVVVEGQSYHAKSKSPPGDIIKLANVAGALAGICAAFQPGIQVAIPKPEDWKGQTKKPINQARTFDRFGISHSPAAGYCYPSGCATSAAIRGAASLNKGDWKEVADAAGLALWGAQQLRM